MAIFNWFGESEHRVFNYKPRYYDPQEEERRKMFGKVDGTYEKQKQEGTYAPPPYLKDTARDRHNTRSRSHENKAQTIIGIVGLILVVIVLLYIAKFYTLL